MYAIAFDLVVADTEQHHPKGVSQAYAEIGAVLAKYGFRRVQGSLYVTDDEHGATLRGDTVAESASLVSPFSARHPGFPH